MCSSVGTYFHKAYLLIMAKVGLVDSAEIILLLLVCPVLGYDESIGYKVGVTLGSAVASLLFLTILGTLFYLFYWKKWYSMQKWPPSERMGDGGFRTDEIYKVDLSNNHHFPVPVREFARTKDFHQNNNHNYMDNRRPVSKTPSSGANKMEYLNSSVSSHASSEVTKAFQLERAQTTPTSIPAIPAAYRGSAV
ncbi:hypothetical protein T01_15865 [Trichinella spiralis]|uniref:Uncharacterized protein n=1 Tax=Trichinella spiralis TaxID=6334 RepID=A0A0V1BFC6_TRISP|nr:hypothetical protein T01_15865 [Trichinella spiralis]